MRKNDINDNFHWRKIINGENDGFRYIYEKYVDDLFSYGMKILHHEEAVKDAIHDMFLDVHAYRSKLSKEVNVKYYLLLSLKRKIISNHKKNSFSLQPDPVETTRFMEFQDGTEQDFIEKESNRSMLELLRNEINSLTEREKEVIYLKYSQDLSYEEISVLMSVTTATTRTLIYRAIKRLRTKLKDKPLSKSFEFIFQH